MFPLMRQPGAGAGWGGEELNRTIEDTFAFFARYLKPAAKP